MKTLIKKAALYLIGINGSTTTLEVKEELIATESNYYWKQSFVSSVLDELAANGELQFTHNGVFRTYELPAATFTVTLKASGATKYQKIPLAQRNVVKTSLTGLAKLVEENAGKFITLVHIKKTTGQTNVMNCQVLKGLTPLGAIQVKEQGQLKTIYPSTLVEARVKNTVYQLK